MSKPNDETRATFSHAVLDVPKTIVVKDMTQTKELAKFITGERPAEELFTAFKGQYSDGLT